MAMAGGIGEAAEPEEQLDLIEADMPLPLAPAQRTGKPGRPAGARNKSAAEFRRLFLAKYRSPVVGLAEAYSRNPVQLAHELRMWRRDGDGNVLTDEQGLPVLADGAVERAFKLQVDCMVAAAPYIEQRQPLAIETKGNRMGVLVMGDLHMAGHNADQLPLPPREQYQQVTDLEPMQSDEPKSET
ncbi:MAG: hypothetical protein IT536_04440 [Hyphomicrobiales bacterium]|nr:hypothetical protein [Hyphomicrobiales bacterium]